MSCYRQFAGRAEAEFSWASWFMTGFWFHHDKFGLTLGGGKMNNPGRYLVLLPPINGADAIFADRRISRRIRADPFKAWDASATFDYMPKQYITFRWEYDHRQANVPYFPGRAALRLRAEITAPDSSVCARYSGRLDTCDLRQRVQSTDQSMARFW